MTPVHRKANGIGVGCGLGCRIVEILDQIAHLLHVLEVQLLALNREGHRILYRETNEERDEAAEVGA